MKLISVLAVAALLASSLATPAFAGLLDGQPADPVKRARPGGYNEQVANLKSLASTNGCDVGFVYVHQQCVCAH